MAYRQFEEKSRGELVFWRHDPDNKKPIRFKLQPVPAAVTKQLRARFTEGKRAEKIGKQPAARVAQLHEDFVRDRAAYALLDSENFAIVIGDDKAREKYSEALGREVQLEEEIVLDGAWTDEVKALVLTFSPPIADWINHKVDEMSALEAEEEEYVQGN